MTKPKIILFHMNGCPHCVKLFVPDENKHIIWNDIKNYANKMHINVYKYEKSDSRNEQHLMHLVGESVKKKLIDYVNARGYPTLFYVNAKGKVYMYDNGAITMDSIKTFIEQHNGNVKNNTKKTYKMGGTRSRRRSRTHKNTPFAKRRRQTAKLA